MAPGVAGGVETTVTAKVLAALVPAELVAVTVTFPELVPKSTVMLTVVPPAVMVAPVGTVQL
jgi:hypothetical protein